MIREDIFERERSMRFSNLASITQPDGVRPLFIVGGLTYIGSWPKLPLVCLAELELVKQLIVALSGASGAVYGVRLLTALRDAKVNVHLTMSFAAEINLKLETGLTMKKLSNLADHVYSEDDLAAPISSGSFSVDGMVVVPCSMKTLAAIANGYSDNLTTRAADVTLKERRTLVLVPRETPLNQIHLRNMLTLAEAGAIIMPASPGFYHSPRNIDQLIDHIVGKIMDAFHIEHNLYKRWTGLP